MSSSLSASCFVTHQGEPFYNMAFDEWLFMSAIRDPLLIAIRLYTWQPGAITIGLNQRAETALDWNAIGSTPVIRRATGGRALYHDPLELTYSLALGAKAAQQLVPEVQTQRIAALIAVALRGFLGKMGIDADFVRRSNPLDQRPVVTQTAPCFASSARFELVSEGRKVVASAQRRIGDTVLQHGSIKIAGIVLHPALRGIGQHQSFVSAEQLIEPEYLASASAKCFDAFSESFGLASFSTGEVADQAVMIRASEIRSAPLGRRDFH